MINKEKPVTTVSDSPGLLDTSQDAEFVTYMYLCHASAYTPLSCRFRELYVHWHGHQVYSEDW